jgi:hypothetical protein
VRARTAVVVGLAAAPPTLWGLHLAITYAIVPESCAAGTTTWLNLTTVFTAVLILGVGTVAALLYRNGRLLDRSALLRARDFHASDPAADRAVPHLAVLFVPYFLLLVVMAGMVFLVVDPCA